MKRVSKFVNYFLILSILLILGCNFSNNENLALKEENDEDKSKLYELIMNCDSIYPNKNYSIKLQQTIDSPPMSLGENSKNYVFELKQNGKIIFADSIFSIVAEINFKDFDNDGIKDILIQNDSDVRSNWTYNLYLVDTLHNSIKKIKGFNQIKNPNFIAEYNLIDNEVMSGRNWTSFYQIQNDTVFDFGYVIYKGIDDNGKEVDFDKKYTSTLKSILKNKNYH